MINFLVIGAAGIAAPDITRMPERPESHLVTRLNRVIQILDYARK